MNTAKGFACDECKMLRVAADEDGCCTACGADCRIVTFVEHNPRAAGVVKAAVALCTMGDPHGERLAALCRAVARMRKSRRLDVKRSLKPG